MKEGNLDNYFIHRNEPKFVTLSLQILVFYHLMSTKMATAMGAVGVLHPVKVAVSHKPPSQPHLLIGSTFISGYFVASD